MFKNLKAQILLLIIVLFSLFSCSTRKPPKLILQLTVDQLRGDVINKFKDSFTKDGFLYLLNNGKNFSNAHYIHSITKTAPGHSTLATGTTPSKHGIINNDWYNQKENHWVYSCDDKDSPFLDSIITKKGVSPKNLMSPTFSDKLVDAHPDSKVFGISVKDRGAIMLGGHKGKAFWFNKQIGDFVSTKYYYDEYPDWINNWRKINPIDKYYEAGWSLLYPKGKYQFYDVDKNNYEKSLPELGYTFPHSFKNMSKEKFYSLIPYSPWGDKLTSEFAKSLIKNENIGQDDIVDYLSISFSCTDYIGHLFGPNTLEYEDQILSLDKTLSDLFHFIDEKIGLENVLIVLSADHGICETPEFLLEQGKKSGVASSLNIAKRINDYGNENLNLNFDLISKVITPYVYLNEVKIDSAGLNLEKLEKELAKVGSKSEGIYNIYTRSEMLNSKIDPKDSIAQFVKNSFYKPRSGNLYIVNEPNWYLAYNPKMRKNAATHGSPWTYDRFVPLIFKGNEIKPGVSDEKVGPQDIAPTLSKLIGIPKPDDTVGKAIL